MELSEKKIFFLHFLFHFWSLHEILNILKEKIFVIAIVFRKLQTVNNLVRTLCEKCRFRTSFDSQHDKASQTLAKSPGECFYHVFSSFSLKLIWKIYLIVLNGMLGVTVNALTADGNYFVQDCHNFPRPIQNQLSEKG